MFPSCQIRGIFITLDAAGLCDIYRPGVGRFLNDFSQQSRKTIRIPPWGPWARADEDDDWFRPSLLTHRKGWNCIRSGVEI